MDSSMAEPVIRSWNGGDNPAPDQLVYFTRRDGKSFHSNSNRLDWEHIGEPTDIVEYEPLPTS